VAEYVAKSLACYLRQLFGPPNIFHELNAYGMWPEIDPVVADNGLFH
jgi:hypothetical protein